MATRKPSDAMLRALAALAIDGNVSTVNDIRGTHIVCMDKTRISTATWQTIKDRGLVNSEPIRSGPSGAAYSLNDAGRALLNAYRPTH